MLKKGVRAAQERERERKRARRRTRKGEKGNWFDAGLIGWGLGEEELERCCYCCSFQV